MEELYLLSEKESKRFSDLKFVGIILIVLIHMSSDAGMESVADFIIYIFSQIIARSAVPVFFMLSGILLYRKQFKWKENIKKKIKTLVIPFVFWNTLWLVVFWMAQKIPSLDFLFKNPMNRVGDFSIFDWIDAYLAIFQRTKPFVYPLWFIKDLLILNCFAPLIKNIVDRIPKGILVILFALYLCRVNLRFIEIQSIVWFTLGYYIVKYNIRIETIQSKVKKSAVAGYIVVVLCLAFAEFHYQRNIYIVHELVIIYGVVMMISEIDIADRLHNEKALHIWKNCVSGTFFVFCAHEWTLLFVRKIIQKVLPNNQILDVLCFFLVPIFVIAALLFIAEMMKRRMPELYRIIVGSRNQEKYNDYETRKYENYKKWGGRIVWLDSLKGICMLCTMVGHYTFFPKDVAACYAPFFLSAFLFAAGYTFHLESSFKRFVEKKIKTVLFPWFWMGLLSLLSRQIISFNSHAGIAKDLQDFFLQIRGRGDEGWFFICLFGSEIVFYLMVSCLKNKKELLVVSVMGSLLSFVYSVLTNDFRLPWHIQMYGAACFFLSLGYIVHQCEKERRVDLLDKKYLPLSAILYIILFVVDCKIIGGESITFYSYGKSIWMYYLLSLISVWMIVLAAKSIKPPKWLIFVGENTLLYYGLHGKVGSVFTAIVTKVIGTDMSRATSVAIGIVGLMFIVVVLMPIIWVINTKMNFLLGKKVGKN